MMMPVGHWIEAGKTFLDEIYKPLMVQISGGRDNDVVGRKSLPVKIKQIFLLEGANRLLGSQNRLAQRMVFPEILGKDLMDQIVRVIFVHLDLFQDHAFLARDVLGIE